MNPLLVYSSRKKRPIFDVKLNHAEEMLVFGRYGLDVLIW